MHSSFNFGSIDYSLYNVMVDIVFLQIKIFDIHLMSYFSIVRSLISYYVLSSFFVFI